MNFVKIAVIIPSRGNSFYLRKCIESLLETDYPNKEIILVDDNPVGIIKERIGELSDAVKVLNSFGKGPSYARNLAAKATDAEFLAFTDDDCIVSVDWLSKLLAGVEHSPDVVSCGGKQKLPVNATAFEKKVFLFMKKTGFLTDYMRNSKKSTVDYVEHNASCNVIYRRDVFLKEEGFLEGFWPGEDVELDYRLREKRHKLVFNPEAVVYHHRSKKLNSFIKMMYRYGKSQGRLFKKYGFFRAIHWVPFYSLFLCVLLLGLFLFSRLVFYGFSLVALILLLSVFKWDVFVFILAFLGGFLWNIGFLRGFMHKK